MPAQQQPVNAVVKSKPACHYHQSACTVMHMHYKAKSKWKRGLLTSGMGFLSKVTKCKRLWWMGQTNTALSLRRPGVFHVKPKVNGQLLK